METNSNNESLIKIPLETHDWIPQVVTRLRKSIGKKPYSKVILLGFSENMKWLSRLLKEDNRKVSLADWRSEFYSYDCGGEIVMAIEKISATDNDLIVICPEEICLMKDCMYFLMKSKLNKTPTLYDRNLKHSPFHEEEPYKSIKDKAYKRARSMISEAQLFDLIQYIKLTKNIEGSVVEYGSLHGGSGAILVEAVNHYGIKPVYLFDTFDGIPESKYGLDYRWSGSFSNNSFKEVSTIFSDCKNVKVVSGNIMETYDSVKGPISFGYLASDTLETGEQLLHFMWDNLSVGGIIAICDYGSYPNCIPLTMYVDKFLENKDVFVFHPTNIGIFIQKK